MYPSLDLWQILTARTPVSLSCWKERLTCVSARNTAFFRKLTPKFSLWRFKMPDSNLRNESNYGIYFAEAFNGSVLDPIFPNDSISTCRNFTLDSQVVGVGIFLSVFILVAIVGNILVILSVVCNKHLQTVTNYFIVNLAMADLLLGIIVLPFSASLEVLGCWVFGRVFCNIWAAVDVLCCTASILSLCIISIDRYIGVKYCLKYPSIMTERRAVAILVLVWVSSTVISVGPLLGWKEPPPVDDSICRITEEPGYALFSSLFSFYLPLMVILIMYFRVYVVARRTTKSLEAGVKRERNKSMEVVLRIHCRSVLEDARPASSKSNKNHPFRSSLSVRLMKFSREKKAAKTLAIVVGMFILCWLPFFFFLPLGSFFPALKPSDTVFKVVFWLGYFNSCINPMIYPCSSKEFQRAFTRLLRCQCHQRRRVLRRFYDQRWRTAVKGMTRDQKADYKTGYAVRESCGSSLLYKGKGRSLGFNRWSLFPPLQKSSFQLKEKVNNLSNKIKGGTGKGTTPAVGRIDIVDTVSMGIYSSCEQNSYQFYDLADCYGLKETDI
ncbi:alpha-1D adrenergic receptor [Toxotes jaculatrix]|uniref:alpha-1D adrenergic receptor n=1 Tax=Toxotes jaculatrix TaxID=941984 RepID=UPI001B3AC2C1|nr:alpha-1D adrenergic receptor [Toxotes jaculatrix]